ncbi:hypothetical protein [Streptomyces thioluteus]|uniref:hypothetical protein n=1 Tax=Streptomyces thioluteus TaxID=66431 RepID=UPI0031EDBB96
MSVFGRTARQRGPRGRCPHRAHHHNFAVESPAGVGRPGRRGGAARLSGGARGVGDPVRGRAAPPDSMTPTFTPT